MCNAVQGSNLVALVRHQTLRECLSFLILFVQRFSSASTAGHFSPFPPAVVSGSVSSVSDGVWQSKVSQRLPFALPAKIAASTAAAASPKLVALIFHLAGAVSDCMCVCVSPVLWILFCRP